MEIDGTGRRKSQAMLLVFFDPTTKTAQVVTDRFCGTIFGRWRLVPVFDHALYSNHMHPQRSGRRCAVPQPQNERLLYL